MPRRVDHEARRTQIAAASNRIAGRDGLRAVTMRAVAAEAGVSVRLVQYYFGTKAELLTGAVRALEAESRKRWARRLDDLGRPPSARALLEAFLDEALPDDAHSRALHRAFHAYTDLSLEDPGFAAQAGAAAGPDELERRIAGALRDARLRPGAGDAGTEAATLLLLSHGLCASVLIGQRTPPQARALWRHHLDRLLA